jgi:hypothetical protein
LLSGKLNHPVWGSGPSNFPVLESCCLAGGRHICNGYLLRSSLHGQNPQQTLTILGGSASEAEPKVRTTPPKEDKVDTSSVEVPIIQALVAQPGSKTSDDNLADDDPDLLNFVAMGSEIICQMSSWLQTCWPYSGKLDCPVFMTHDVGLAFLVLGHEDVECGHRCGLLPSFFCH